VADGPQGAIVIFDDSAADGQADARAVTLAREEGFEESVCDFWGEAHPFVSHAEPHAMDWLALRLDQQLPRVPPFEGPHRIPPVQEQVQDDLLELDAIAGHERQRIAQLRSHDDPVSLKLAA